MCTTKFQDDLDKAAKILNWNERLLSTLGLWPLQPNYQIFNFWFIYWSVHMILEFIDLFLHINSLDHIIENLSETMSFLQVLINLFMIKKRNHKLKKIIIQVANDYNEKFFNTKDECCAFLDYINKAKFLCKFLIIYVAFIAPLYYSKGLSASSLMMTSDEHNNNNSSVSSSGTFILPYRFHIFYEINDLTTYGITYAAFLPVVYITGMGYLAIDCLLITLTFHICGKLSALSLRISSIVFNPISIKKQFNDILIEHNRLLTIGKYTSEIFSEILFMKFVSATMNACLLGFQLITNSGKENDAGTATLVVYIILVFVFLTINCKLGDCLIKESENVCNAFYNCAWYEKPNDISRNCILGILRSQKSLCLTNGKFGIYCLATVTTVIKTSMGYLSVLRSLLTIE